MVGSIPPIGQTYKSLVQSKKKERKKKKKSGAKLRGYDGTWALHDINCSACTGMFAEAAKIVTAPFYLVLNKGKSCFHCVLKLDHFP